MTFQRSILAGLFCVGSLAAQTTQGLISGVVSDAVTGQPLPGTSVEYSTKLIHGSTLSGPDGSYNLPLLAPGTYRLQASKQGYQSRGIYELQLTVGGYLSIQFPLRPIGDVWERNVPKSIVLSNQSVLSYLGPDVDPTFSGTFDPAPNQRGQFEPSISEVIDPLMLATLPLTGRDVYTALAWMPGVASDAATARSLGLSANGQRPTSSNFLLDGVELNNQLLSGPAISLPPEAVSEYRVSTNNFSAEYGGTSGYIANAITKSGGTAWHGIAYSDLQNDALNANTFENNADGLERTPLKVSQSGFNTGGPISRRHKLYSSTSFEYFRSRSFGAAESYALPTKSFAESLPSSSLAAQIFQAHPPVMWGQENGGIAPATETSLRPTVSLNRWDAVEHLDYHPAETELLTVRLAVERITRPDFMWTPYGDSELRQTTLAASAGWVKTWSPTLTSEVRGGYERFTLNWQNPLGNFPDLEIVGGPINLPSGGTAVAFSGGLKSSELRGLLVSTRGRNVIKVGASFQPSSTQSGVNQNASFTFGSISAFAVGAPYLVVSPVSLFAYQNANRVTAPTTSGLDEQHQFSGFLQEDFRWTHQLTLNFGLRAEHFGAPTDAGGTPETTVALGAGPSITDEIHNASLVSQSGGSLYKTDAVDWAGRFGFAYSFSGTRPLVIRGGYGIFYDRPYDNFWSSAVFNDIARGAFDLSGDTTYLNPGRAISSTPLTSVDFFYNVTVFQSKFRPPYAQSMFLGAERELTRRWNAQINLTGALGRRLLTNDIWNRDIAAIPLSSPNNNLPELNYRGTQGDSDYAALIVSSRYASKHALVQVFYTWSHSIDNQSDPLIGDFFDLGFANQVDRDLLSHYYAGFTYAYDSRVDRGNSDFDQRQNLVALATYNVDFAHGKPAGWLLQNWTASGVYALRSGLPYTVLVGGDCEPVCNTRAMLGTLPPDLASPVRVAGGELLLNQNAFSRPPALMTGNLGRNSLVGPKLQNFDLSIARIFPIRRFGEAARFTVRADAYNAPNHPNLSNPQAFLLGPNFGVASYGRAGRPGFPSLTPFNETSRQIEILLRFEF